MEEENDILEGDDSGRGWRKLLGRSSVSWDTAFSLASMLDCECLCPSTRDNCDPLRVLPLPLNCVFGILSFYKILLPAQCPSLSPDLLQASKPTLRS